MVTQLKVERVKQTSIVKFLTQNEVYSALFRSQSQISAITSCFRFVFLPSSENQAKQVRNI